jgi:predicted NAD-dependent protein-ADP-ribosyltransferase YbiA (DUF1768 family)
MKTLLKPDALVLLPESDVERDALDEWKKNNAENVFVANENPGPGAALIVLGPRSEACREPINVTSHSPDERIRLIANFAPTAFDLDGGRYASVESFWQSLRFPVDQRARIAGLDGAEAKKASSAQPYGSHIDYGDRSIMVGTWDHWQLMRRACQAKFEQNANAREALLATGDRPLIHKVRFDSRTIPGVIMAEIWTKLRARLRSRNDDAGDHEP